ncbi:MAG: hypothetical protein ACKO26_20625, partial [Planctomycetota bacterium]
MAWLERPGKLIPIPITQLPLGPGAGFVAFLGHHGGASFDHGVGQFGSTSSIDRMLSSLPGIGRSIRSGSL